MKIMRIKNNITVILEDGTMLTSTACTDEMHEEILANQNDPKVVKDILLPTLGEMQEEIQEKRGLMDGENSRYLSVCGTSVYLKSISELSLPEDLAMAIWRAEQKGDQELLNTYIHFWTLASLNPDSRARTNLFWFLDKYGMTISKSGLFVAYRNVKLKREGSRITTDWAKFITESFTKVKFKHKKSPKNYFVGLDTEGNKVCKNSESKLVETKGILSEMYDKLSDEDVAPIYTDRFTGTFTIKIGEPVTMDRKKCDSKQENTCSRGLHVAGKSWLSNDYFGEISLRVLVNPADVVAVPPQDSYGKMRVCAYYPVSVVSFDQEGNIIDEDIEDGFEDNFMEMISYVGDMNEEEEKAYNINIPEIPEINSRKILNRIDDIRKSLAAKHLD